MLGMVGTLIRATASRAEERIGDANALLVLEQQIRDSASELVDARRALAVAVARQEAENRRIAAIGPRIDALEAGAVDALMNDRADLAFEAATAIAALENDLSNVDVSLGEEVGKLRASVADATRRLSDLERGRRIAEAAEAVRRLRGIRVHGQGGASSLAQAEATLRRLRGRQVEDAAADRALSEIEGAASPDGVARRLAAEGFGPSPAATPKDVMARLNLLALSKTMTEA